MYYKCTIHIYHRQRRNQLKFHNLKQLEDNLSGVQIHFGLVKRDQYKCYDSIITIHFKPNALP